MLTSPAGSSSSEHTAGPGQTREELRKLRPDLVRGYDAELPGARAAVLGRLLGALDREPLPRVSGRREGEVRFADGTVVRFPAAAARAFAPGRAGLSVTAIVPRRSGNGRRIDDPGELVRVLWGDVPLAREVDNSVANLALARAGQAAGPAQHGLAQHGPAQHGPGRDGPEKQGPGTNRPGTNRPERDRPERDRPATSGPGLIEQLVVDGHPLHPCCRTRGGMSVADVLAYAPEHRPVIRLRRFAVPEGRWYGTAPPVLLAHPWQAERIRDRYPWLTDDGETGPVRPLMSLRTVAPLDGGPHVKTAVDVQMTSAVRTVSPAAVHNGPRLSALLAALTADLPLDVLAETAAGAVIADGQPQRHLAFLTREAPPDDAIPLAAVPRMLAHVVHPYEFMALLGEILFAPLMTVLDRGVALEAHGQNTLLVLRDGRPHRILYRDLGGVRVSASRLRAAGLEPPDLHGDLPTDDPAVLRTKLAAAALGTVAAELIAAFERHGADPERLWALVAASIATTPDGKHLLTDPLPVKATTAMRLAADPLDDLWAHLPNPMAAHA